MKYSATPSPQRQANRGALGRLAAAVALVLIVGSSLFLIPRQAVYSLSTTITTSKAEQQMPSVYSLGETVTFVARINFAGGEARNITNVTLTITGPQSLTMTLPVEPGMHNLTANLPKDGSNQPLGQMVVTVATQNISYIGYGYGYGYAGSGGGTITYTIAYTPPLYLYPPPGGLGQTNGAYQATLTASAVGLGVVTSTTLDFTVVPLVSVVGFTPPPPPAAPPPSAPAAPPAQQSPPATPPAPPGPPAVTPQALQSLPTAAAAAQVLAAPAQQAAEALQQVSTPKAGEILAAVPPKKATEVMQALPTPALAQIVTAMPEAALTAALPGLSVDKLNSIPAATLFSALPNAPTVQLVGAVPPKPPADLPAPVVVLATATGERFLAVRTKANEWAVLAGTPAPVSKLMVRTTAELSNVETAIEALPGLPAEIKAAPSAGKVAHYFSITVKNAPPEKVSAGYIEFKVERSWLADNNVHPWSVTLHRFDTALGQWMPLETKKLREDASLVYFSATLPKFSVFAITGATAAPVRDYSVDRVSIGPENARAGQSVKVSAEVNNKLGQQRTVPITLYVNGTAEEVKLVQLAAQGKATVTFNVTKNSAGTYEVRIDRATGRFTVTAGKAGLPAWTYVVIAVILAAAAVYLFGFRRRRVAVRA